MIIRVSLYVISTITEATVHVRSATIARFRVQQPHRSGSTIIHIQARYMCSLQPADPESSAARNHDNDHLRRSFAAQLSTQQHHKPLAFAPSAVPPSPASSNEEEQGERQEGKAKKQGRRRSASRPATPLSSREWSGAEQEGEGAEGKGGGGVCGHAEQDNLDEADVVEAILSTLRSISQGAPPEHQDGVRDLTWNLSKSRYSSLRTHWEETSQKDALSGWILGKARLEYHSSTSTLLLRMPTAIHDGIAGLVANELVEKLTALAGSNPMFSSLGEPVRYCMGDIDLNASKSRFCPDGGVTFRHHLSEAPGLVIEVDYSNPLLEDKIDYYFSDTDGYVCCILAPKIEYRPLQDRKATQGQAQQAAETAKLWMTLWRLVATDQLNDDGEQRWVPRKVVDMVEIPELPTSSESTTESSGTLVFLQSDFHESLPSEPAFSISYTRLREIMDEAVRVQKTRDAKKGAHVARRPKRDVMSFKRKREEEGEEDEWGESEGGRDGEGKRAVKKTRSRGRVAAPNPAAEASGGGSENRGLPSRRRSERLSQLSGHTDPS